MRRFGKIFEVILFLLASTLFLSGCPGGEEGSGADPRTILTDIEFSVFEQINRYRTEQGLVPLAIDLSIVDQARNHSQNMADGIVPFGHEGLNERAAATGIKIGSVSENVAYHQDIPDLVATVVSGWLQSEGHHRNIVGDFNLTGIGVIKNPSGRYYFTQIFIRSAGEDGLNLSWLRFWDR